jgi:hypothetical protein
MFDVSVVGIVAGAAVVVALVVPTVSVGPIPSKSSDFPQEDQMCPVPIMTELNTATQFCVPDASLRVDGALVSCRFGLRRQFVTFGEFRPLLNNRGKVTARALEKQIFE